MREEGVEAVIMSDELAIVGLPEIARALPMFLRSFRRLKRAAVDRKPRAAVLVDFPDFNLKLAKSLKRLGITVIYYISPQLWAWRSYRVRTIRKYVDLMITILPFEKDWYKSRGIANVEYVGNPLATEVRPDMGKQEFCAKHELDPERLIIALLPGSRRKEISRILRVMLEACEQISKSRPEIQFVIAAADGQNAATIRQIAGSAWKVVVRETYELLNSANAAAVTSGTATLEAAIIGTPMAVVYKTSQLNYALLRPLISVEHFGLVNLTAGKRISKELIQDDLTPESLSAELFKLLDPEQNEQSRAELAEATEKLGHGGASKRAAEAILRALVSKD
jgi:lipid-A-disaccharide synthase